MAWIDVGRVTVEAEAVQYVEDTRPEHGYGFAKGMKSVVTLRSGRWFYARMGRSAILRRVKAATDAPTQPSPRAGAPSDHDA